MSLLILDYKMSAYSKRSWDIVLLINSKITRSLSTVTVKNTPWIPRKNPRIFIFLKIEYNGIRKAVLMSEMWKKERNDFNIQNSVTAAG